MTQTTRKKKRADAQPSDLRLVGLLVVVLLLIWGAGANAGSSALTWSEDHKLSSWIDKDLTPYLAETLSKHPRFKGEPVRFVSVEGEKIREDIDNLTREIIARLRHGLQKTPGVNLVWQPDRFAEAPCYEINEPEYHIAIEVIAQGNHRYRIAVRALDVHERSWVSGFGREWQGALSRDQRVALGRRDSNSELLGQRNHPYSEAQTDLLAQELAQTLNRRFCGFVGEPLVVFADPAEGAASVVNKTLALVGNYLSRSQQVTVTRDVSDANVIVGAKIVRIDKGLHQYWLMVRPVARDLDLPELDTQAYVRLDALPRPVVASRPTQKRPPPELVVTPAASRSTMLSAVAIVTPRDSRNCRSSNPWRFGPGITSPGNVVAEDGCFAFEVRSNRDTRVFLLNIDDEIGLVRLLPSSCRTFGRVRTTLARGETLRFPSPDKGTYHVLDAPGRAGSETFYAIAVTDRRAADRIDEHVAQLVDPCNTRSQRATDRVRLKTWLGDMQDTIDDLGERAYWQSVQVRYVSRHDAVASRD